MKSRIIESLISLAADKNESLKKMLTEEIPEEKIQPHAQLALDNILHDYSNFSVSTIDSFFNRIIRSLAREIQLPLRLEIQLDQDEVIAEITAQLMQEISNDKELLGWLTDFTIQKLGDDKGWNIEGEIHAISRELFRENSIDSHSHNRKEISRLFQDLKSIRSAFENQMKVFGNEGMKTMAAAGLEVKDFAYGDKGVARYFESVRMKIPPEAYRPGKRAMEAATDSSKWSSKTSPLKKEITALAENTLQPLLREMMAFVDDEFPVYLGAVEVLKRIFLLGIVEDLRKKLAKYRDENNLLLISDTPKILSTVISDEETPFLYEKSGTRYHHFLIDEFQDTSDLQWKNIFPLVINALGNGNFAMIVGDVKQSIYRWRSGNMHLLDSGVERDLAGFRSIISKENLDTNYRSKKTIIGFNNNLFTAFPPVLQEMLGSDEKHLMHRAYGSEVIQLVTEKNSAGGYVEVSVIEEETSEGEIKTWKDAARKKMLESIRDALSRGYGYGDMAVLVRNNFEGDDAASYLIANGIHQVVSPDSLLLSRSPEIRFLLNVFIFLEDNHNQVAKSEILFYHASKNKNAGINPHDIFKSTGKKSAPQKKIPPTLFSMEPSDDSLFSALLPENFTTRMVTLSKLPLYELCERLVQIFSLDKNDAYVLRFLEFVLEYSGKHDSSLKSFLNWWNDSNAEEKISVITSETGNAIRIMSIHKSKGLQFPIVIVPFADWKLLPDQRDVLWVESEAAPFAGFGKIPVSPNNAMKQSCFAGSYQEELVQSVTDNINLMYVAFTRAEEELYVFTPSAEIKEMNTTGKLLRTAIAGNGDWSAGFSVDKKLVLGKAERKIAKEKKESSTAFAVEDYPSLDWHHKIRLSLKSDELLEMLDSPLKQAINYGVLAHRTLSAIQKKEDVSRVVEEFHAEGILNEAEKQKLLREIYSLLENHEIASFFSDEYKVMNEHEMILPGGEILRPDRVLLKNNKAIVIDFKTGREHPGHHQQISNYAEALSKMNFDAVEKYLVYIGEKRILRVQ